MKKIMFSLVPILVCSSIVFANDTSKDMSTADVLKGTGLYVGAGYGYYNQSSDLSGADATVQTVMFDLGIEANKYLDFEWRYWLGVTDPDTDLGSVNGDHYSWGGYIKPKYPVAEMAEVYALLGYAQNSINFKNGAGNTFMDGFSWGLGASYLLNKNISFALDYVNMGTQSSTSLDGHDFDYDMNAYTVNIGVNYKF